MSDLESRIRALEEALRPALCLPACIFVEWKETEETAVARYMELHGAPPEIIIRVRTVSPGDPVRHSPSVS